MLTIKYQRKISCNVNVAISFCHVNVLMDETPRQPRGNMNLLYDLLVSNSLQKLYSAILRQLAIRPDK